MPGYDRFLSSKIKSIGGPKWDEFIRTLATDIAKLTEGDQLDKQIADRLLGRGLQVIEDLVTPVAAQAQTRVDQIDTLINQGTSDVQAFVAAGQGQVNTFVAAAQSQVDSLEGEADAAVVAVNAAAAQIAQYLADLQGQGISADLVNETATRLWLTAALKATYDGYAAAIAARAPLASPALTGAPTAPTVDGTADSTTKIATTEFVQAVVAAAKASILNGSPAALDTLAELAAAIGDDSNFAATVTTALGNRVRFDAAQSLSEGQKIQARANIGAGTSNFDGAYDSLSGKPTLGDAAAKNTGTAAGTVAAGNDARITGAVQKSGDETVNGIKTFGSIPVGPASDPTSDNQLARKAYVDGKGGQPVPTSSSFAVGTLALCFYTGSNIANGSTVAGSSLYGVTVADTGTVVSNGVALSGTWKNVSGVTLGASAAKLVGYWVRTV